MPYRKNRQQPEKSRSSPSGRRRPLSQVNIERRDLPPAYQAALHLQRTIGNRATAALIQRQDNEGSLTVAGSASADETAADRESYTQGLAGDRSADETPSEREFSEALENEALSSTITQNDTKKGFKSQHPSLAQLGIRPKEIKGNKIAAYIGNSSYKHNINWDNLPGAKADAEKMKGVMEGHKYTTLTHSEDKTSPQIESIFRGAVAFAGAGDALLLYYAGHGLPHGLAGVESKQADPITMEPQEESEDEGRGFKAPEAITDIAPYTEIMGNLEGGVARGVHTTFIADACHSGAASDLVRVKAEEKLAESDNDKVGAVGEQIKRLEDLKAQVPSAEGTEADEANKVYWEEAIRPELKAVEIYLKEAGVDIQIPQVPSDYMPGAMEQPINMVINALIDLGELLKQESEESTLEKAL